MKPTPKCDQHETEETAIRSPARYELMRSWFAWKALDTINICLAFWTERRMLNGLMTRKDLGMKRNILHAVPRSPDDTQSGKHTDANIDRRAENLMPLEAASKAIFVKANGLAAYRAATGTDKRSTDGV